MEQTEGVIDVQAAPRMALGAWLGNTPWWLLSAGIHMVVLLATTLIYMESLVAAEPGGIPVSLEGPTKLVDTSLIEKQRDIIERDGLKTDEMNPADSNDEPIIWNPDAEPSDRNTSNDGEDFGGMKGQSLDYISHITGIDHKGSGTPTMGVGPDNGFTGRYGGTHGDNKDRRKVGSATSATPATENAVLAALRWLARHQSPDGSWKAAAFDAQCAGGKCAGAGDSEFDVGLTALSVLAFLGAGYTHMSKDVFRDPAAPDRVLNFGKVVNHATKWLVANQDAEGCVGLRSSRHMYNHAIAALALSEAYGMTGATIIREPAQKAVDFLVAAQNPGKGWRYTARAGDNDSSITGWAVMALKSAEISGLTFPHSAYDGAIAWFNEVTKQDGYYGVGYVNNEPDAKVHNDKNKEWDNHYSMTAVALMARIFIEKKRGPALAAVGHLTNDLPEWSKGKVDFYYWYYASLAIFQCDTLQGGEWKKWNEPMKNALLPHQKVAKDGCANGSWSTEEDRWAMEGGRVYATAINALTLEVYYRYPKVFGAK